jgi:glycosyltransferase involved in cell wall biosynthesis
MEVIFVDDGSGDETLSIIEGYVPRMDMKVKVFHHEWKGLGASRNVVVDNASGDYIIWVDGDMIMPMDHVRKQVEFMDKNPKVGIAKARYGFITSNSVVATLENIPFILYYCSKNSSLDSKLPGTGGSIYRVEAVKEADGFDNCLKAVGEDQDIAYRIMSAGWLIKVSDAFFFEREEESWNSLWKKYIWYGYGNYFLHKKNKRIFRIYKMIPPIAFLAGLLCSFSAFRLTSRKIVFLLPLHFVFKSTGWCWGFIKARLANVSMTGNKKCCC